MSASFLLNFLMLSAFLFGSRGGIRILIQRILSSFALPISTLGHYVFARTPRCNRIPPLREEACTTNNPSIRSLVLYIVHHNHSTDTIHKNKKDNSNASPSCKGRIRMKCSGKTCSSLRYLLPSYGLHSVSRLLLSCLQGMNTKKRTSPSTHRSNQPNLWASRSFLCEQTLPESKTS